MKLRSLAAALSVVVASFVHDVLADSSSESNVRQLRKLQTIPSNCFAADGDDLRDAVNQLRSDTCNTASDCPILQTYGPVEDWCVSYVQNFDQVWTGSDLLESKGHDITKWDTSSAISMKGTFGGSRVFNQDISGWNVSQVKDMSQMFNNAAAFNQDLSAWDVSQVTDMTGTFANADAFNGDISTWDVSQVTSIAGIFSRAKAFNRDVSQWNVSSVVNTKSALDEAVSFNQDLCVWENKISSTVLKGMCTTNSATFCATICDGSPTRFPTSKPTTASPTNKPTLLPGPQITTTTSASLSIENFTLPNDEQDLKAIATVLEGTIASTISATLNDTQAVQDVTVTSIGGTPVGRRRRLKSSTVEYIVTMTMKCAASGCLDDTLAKELEGKLKSSISDAIANGSFDALLKDIAGLANALALLGAVVKTGSFGSFSFERTSAPSSDPSTAPSCTPSQAPTPSPMVNLFYPDQTNGGSGCLNDGEQAPWMEANPSYWLYSTLDKCCKAHFGWNYNTCMGNLQDTCARALFFPDWEGENKSCVRDGEEPAYMTRNPAQYMFNSKKDCCDQYYSWMVAECMGGAEAGSGSSWYSDWTSGDNTCKNDGKAPDYMTANKSMWLYENQEDCCIRHFSYSLVDCMGFSGLVSSNSGATSGKYYPDWAGENEGCLVDAGSTPAPEYMHSSGTWFYETLNQCCEKHYGYNLSGCKGQSAPSTATGTNKYYVDWVSFKCVKDCVGTGCGGFAKSWDILYDTKEKCCSERVEWDTKDCIA